MNKNLQWKGSLLLAALAVAAVMPLAPKAAAADSAAVSMTVTAVGKKDTQPPALKKEDVQLYQGKEKTQVADWKRGETLYSIAREYGTTVASLRQSNPFLSGRSLVAGDVLKVNR